MSMVSAEEAKRRPIEIAGYAIVSDDDKIAGADGLLPPSMRNEKDWEYYQRALAGSDIIVFGHRSHEARAQRPGRHASRDLASLRRAGEARRRVVVEPGADEMGGRDEGDAAARRRRGGPGRPGGVRSLLDIGFDVFNLSRAHGVTLPGGRSIFSACDTGVSAEAVLAKAGLSPAEKIPLDPEHGVAMTVWRREPARPY